MFVGSSKGNKLGVSFRDMLQSGVISVWLTTTTLFLPQTGEVVTSWERHFPFHNSPTLRTLPDPEDELQHIFP